jgi:(5-formylfuran-3-yl)methyl phosphate synthase
VADFNPTDNRFGKLRSNRRRMTESISGASNGAASTPQLLVSVRSAAEAVAAVSGGCDILGVKDPARGPLGMADVSVIEQVLQTGRAAGVPVSAALGEVSDYPRSATLTNSNRRLPDSLVNLSFTKIGLANLGHDSNWQARWQDTMSLLAATSATKPDADSCTWVAVIYADWQQAAAPSPDDIVDSVLSSSWSTGSRIAGVLVDTWSKRSGRLLDSLPVEQLRDLASSVQQSDRFFAVAGRLTSGMLPELVSVRPDIVAVRSAACRNEDRTSSVDGDAVRRLRTEIDRTFAAASSNAALPIGTSHEKL